MKDAGASNTDSTERFGTPATFGCSICNTFFYPSLSACRTPPIDAVHLEETHSLCNDMFRVLRTDGGRQKHRTYQTLITS